MRDASHNRLLAVPALLYAVNNYLKFVMQLYFKPTTAKMLGNSKIIVIALLMRSVLRRHFSVFQWEALFLLVAGITVNQLNYCAGGGGGLDAVTPAAVFFTITSVTLPSLASVYNEAALKRHMDTSVLLQNFFLYFFGATFNLCGLLGMLTVHRALGDGAATPLFHGFSAVRERGGVSVGGMSLRGKAEEQGLENVKGSATECPSRAVLDATRSPTPLVLPPFPLR